MTLITDGPVAHGPAAFVARLIALFERIPLSLAITVARIGIAGVFWQSGQTKVTGFALNDSAIYLFENEYRLPLIDPWLPRIWRRSRSISFQFSSSSGLPRAFRRSPFSA